MLLHVVFETAVWQSPYAELLNERLLQPLGLFLHHPAHPPQSIAQLPPELMRRVVQNHDEDGGASASPATAELLSLARHGQMSPRHATWQQFLAPPSSAR